MVASKLVAGLMRMTVYHHVDDAVIALTGPLSVIEIAILVQKSRVTTPVQGGER